MVASSWKLRLDPTAESLVDDWLRDEKVAAYDISCDRDLLEVELHDIDDAFRFRLQFDEDILA